MESVSKESNLDTYIVEFYEEGSNRFRAVRVKCDKKEYAHIEAMRVEKVSKVVNVYLEGTKPNGTDTVSL